MNKARRVIFMVIAVMAFMIPNVKRAEAALWASGGGYWNAGPFCRNGVQVTGRMGYSQPPDDYPTLSWSFTAYRSNIPATDQPQVGSSNLILIYGEAYGSVVLDDITVKPHPLPYTDENHQVKYDWVWDQEIIYYGEELPVGTRILVRRTPSDGGAGTFTYFLANTMNCRV